MKLFEISSDYIFSVIQFFTGSVSQGTSATGFELWASWQSAHFSDASATYHILKAVARDPISFFSSNILLLHMQLNLKSDSNWIEGQALHLKRLLKHPFPYSVVML